ncbi:MAG TPA: DUF3592 domain-containing protein [Alphaproteobacteria bacterium]|nr:DUF3592 domain-containing protein [Alphaproteobacteria bacterium]
MHQTSWKEFGAIALIVIGWEFLKWAIRRFRTVRAQAWPTVSGTVEHDRQGEPGYPSFEGSPLKGIFYSYSVGGERYSGIHVLEFRTSTLDFLEGERVLVHYKPSDPSVSFLDLEEEHHRREAAENS